MRLATFRENRRRALGIVWGGRLINFNAAHRLMRRQQGRPWKSLPVIDMKGFLSGGHEAYRLARQLDAWVKERAAGKARIPAAVRRVLFDLDQVRITAPISDPPKIMCLARNYVSHAREVAGDAPLPRSPLVFMKPTSAIIGPGQPVVVSPSCKQLDHEVELAVVVGRKGRHIPNGRAMDHVAGYTILNDVSDRGYVFQEETQRIDWFSMKAQDTFAPLGPHLVLKDEIEDPHRLRLRLWVNGELRQDSTGEEMIFKIPEILTHISRFVTVEPGDIIATGTPSGTSFSTKQYLKASDVMVCEIEGIGTLENPVKVEQEVYR